MRLAAASALFAMVLGSAVSAEVRVTDGTGAEVRLAQPARRIVALSPDVVEILFEVGAGKRVVGVTQGCDYPREVASLPLAGTYSNPDMEAILALRPDLVVMAYGNPAALAQAMRRRGTAVYVHHATKLAHIPEAMREIAALADSEEAGRAAAERFERRVDEVRARTAGKPPRRTLVVIWDRPKLTVAGHASLLDEALSAAGGTNAAPRGSQAYPELDAEQVLQAAPEAAVLAMHGAERAAETARMPGFRLTTAARTGALVSVHPDILLRAGPRLAEGLAQMAEGLHPEAGAADASVPNIQPNPETRRAHSPDWRVVALGLILTAAGLVWCWLQWSRRSAPLG